MRLSQTFRPVVILSVRYFSYFGFIQSLMHPCFFHNFSSATEIFWGRIFTFCQQSSLVVDSLALILLGSCSVRLISLNNKVLQNFTFLLDAFQVLFSFDPHFPLFDTDIVDFLFGQIFFKFSLDPLFVQLFKVFIIFFLVSFQLFFKKFLFFLNLMIVMSSIFCLSFVFDFLQC